MKATIIVSRLEKRQFTAAGVSGVGILLIISALCLSLADSGAYLTLTAAGVGGVLIASGTFLNEAVARKIKMRGSR